jgi:glycine/D-amino acid oxidase-like deaminating enzyme
MAAISLSAFPLSASAGTTAVGKRVVVLGRWLAGLSSAHNLMKAGYDVTVLEAHNRPGGRGPRFVPPAAGQPWLLAGPTPAEQLDPTALIRPYLLASFTNLGDVPAAD